jgi:hypothetical protein
MDIEEYKNLTTFANYVLKGYRKANGSKIVICSLMRNCEENFDNYQTTVLNIVCHFWYHRIIIFENDSEDKTREFLISWKSKSRNFIPVLEDSGKPEHGSIETKDRILDMARYRNVYLEKIKLVNDVLFEPDFIIVLDSDIQYLSIEGIMHSLGILEDVPWDAVTANGIDISPYTSEPIYYDTWSLITSDNQWRKDTPLKPFPRNFTSGNINSGFGGCAIYKYSSIKDCRYDAVTIDGEVAPEHTGLHQMMVEKGCGNILINPHLMAIR